MRLPALTALAISAVACRAQPFQGLGLPTGALDTRVHGLSADGSTVVGEVIGTGQVYIAFHWTAASGVVTMGPLTGGTRSRAQAVSADGSVIVGEGESGIGHRPFRWTQAGGYELIPPPPGSGGFPYGVAVSADGSVVAGYWNGPPPIPWRWTAGGGTAAIASAGYATGVSADGQIVAGAEPAAPGSHSFCWTSATGAVSIATPTGWDTSFANAVSANGLVIVGFVEAGPVPAAWAGFRWTAAQGPQELPRPGGANAIARAVSADGSVIVGNLGDAAYAWTPAGPVNLQQFLLSQGASLQGWTLADAVAVSADGRTIAGIGTNPAGQSDSWVAHLSAGFGCYANCDNSGAAPALNVADFTCFLNRFFAGDSYANCDGSTAPPTLNVSDFTCFLNSFAAGCP
jgi:uncharacterized membrane protein